MAQKPNILFFFTDDQRFDTLHGLGNPEIQTPNMDRLVHEGTSFSDAYIMGGSCPAVCMPSRAMLMTGRTLYHLDDCGQGIPPEHELLGETLRRAGYRTFGTGKWHNGPASYARSFTDGASIFFGGMNDHWRVPVADYDPSGEYPESARYQHEGVHSSDLFCGEAARFIREYDDERPFFAYVSFMAPHDPRETHQRYHDLYDPEHIELPPNFLSEHPFDNGELRVRDELLAGFPRDPEEIKHHIAEYYAMITHADAQMGVVMDALRERGLYENTIILFAGDNGLALGQHGLMGKQSCYDHSVHVPLVMAGPGIPVGQSCDVLCYLLDIYPTLCDLVDVAIPTSVEGMSLLPAIESCESGRESLFFGYRDLHRAVRERRWKLIEYVVQGQRTTQLFDLENDPYEMDNLADKPEQQRTLKRLRTRLMNWRRDLGDDREREAAFWRGYTD